MWDEITYPFTNFSSSNVHVITYPCWGLSWYMLVKTNKPLCQVLMQFCRKVQKGICLTNTCFQRRVVWKISLCPWNKFHRKSCQKWNLYLNNVCVHSRAIAIHPYNYMLLHLVNISLVLCAWLTHLRQVYKHVKNKYAWCSQKYHTIILKNSFS